MMAAKKQHQILKFMLSTQANTTNWMATKFWYESEAKRVVLARELTLKKKLQQ